MLFIGDAQRFNGETAVCLFSSQRNKENLVFGMVDCFHEFCFHFFKPEGIKHALENRKLEAIAESFSNSSHIAQPLGIGDVIANDIALSFHRVVNPQ